MAKLLIAGGCSYTDPNFASLDSNLSLEESGGWPMWPEHMGKNLGLKVINTAVSGSDNLTIHNRILREIFQHGDAIGLICVLWSGYDRFRFMNFRPVNVRSKLYESRSAKNPYYIPNKNDFLQEEELVTWWDRLVSHKKFNASAMIKGSFVDSFTYMNSIAFTCDLLKIPYIFSQGVAPFNPRLSPFNRDKAFERSLKEIVKTPIYSHLEKRKNNIIGWPFVGILGGESVDQLRDKWKNPLAISENDYHPNAECQKWISEIFMKKYREFTDE